MWLNSCKDPVLMPETNEPQPISTPIAPITYNATFFLSDIDSAISVMNTETNEFMGNITITHAKYPSSFALSSLNKSIVVTMANMKFNNEQFLKSEHFGKDHKTGFMLKLSTQNGATLASSKIHGVNLDAAYSIDEKEIWTTHFHDEYDKQEVGRVLVLDANNLLETGFVEVGNIPIDVAFSKDGETVYVLNYGSESVTVINYKTKTKITEIKVGKKPTKLILSDENHVLVLNEFDKSISVINTISNSIERVYEIGVKPTGASLSPRGDLWISSDETNKIYFYSKNADVRTGEMNCGEGCNELTFSKDGKYCFVTNSLEQSISKIDVSTKKMIKSKLVNLKPNKIVAIN